MSAPSWPGKDPTTRRTTSTSTSRTTSKHFIGGHLGRLGTRDDIVLHQQYIADIEASAREALASADPTGYFMKYGETSGPR